MINLKHLIVIAILIVIPQYLLSQSIQTNFDRKVIMTDSLNLPKNSSAINLINLLSELLERPSNRAISNYDIQIEGMSVGTAADVALNQLQIVDILKVEVIESPISSYKNNGQGGVINLVLRSSGTNDKKLWGSAGAAATKDTEVAPQFTIGYKQKKFMVRGIVLGEIFGNTNSKETVVFNNDELATYSSTENENRLVNQVAHAFMQYSISDRDMLKLNISEVSSHKKDLSTENYNYAKTTTNKDTYTNVQAQLRYEHTMPHGKFSSSAQIGYSPSNKSYAMPAFYEYTNDISARSISGQISYRHGLLNRTTSRGMFMNVNCEVGSNFNRVVRNENTSILDMQFSTEGHHSVIEPNVKTFYFMPYMNFDCTIGKLKLKAAIEYQNFKYNIRQKDNVYDDVSINYTGKVMAEWHFSQRRNLRLILNRSLERPTDEQIYPYLVFSPSRLLYVKGNTELSPMLTHEIIIDYIANYSWSDYHSIIFNAGASLNRITDIIVSYKSADNTSGLGSSLNFLSFKNSGSNTIASGNLMALYSYKTFSLSLTGNVYHKMKDENDKSNHYTFYNLSIFPYFNLKEGWHGGARLSYSSKVNTADGTLADCAVASIKVGKAWKKFFVYLAESMPFNIKAKDVTKSVNGRTENIYQMVDTNVTLGFKYVF